LEFGTGIKLPFQKTIFRCFRNFLSDLNNESIQPEDKINLNTYSSVYNHFYNGTWQKPVSDTYWIHNDNIYALATRFEYTLLSFLFYNKYLNLKNLHYINLCLNNLLQNRYK